MATGYYLTESDLKILKAMIEAWLSAEGGRSGRPRSWWDLEVFPSNEVVIAFTPSGGIPALTEGADVGTALGSTDLPGNAVCEIYRLTGEAATKQLRPVGNLNYRVYNFMPIAIKGNMWIIVMRDRWGDWVVPNIGQTFDNCP